MAVKNSVVAGPKETNASGKLFSLKTKMLETT